MGPDFLYQPRSWSSAIVRACRSRRCLQDLSIRIRGSDRGLSSKLPGSILFPSRHARGIAGICRKWARCRQWFSIPFPYNLRTAPERTVGPGSPTPVETETGAVPADDSLRLHEEENVGPARSKAAGSCPKESVPRVYSWARPFTFAHGDLLSKGENFEGGIAPTEEEDSDDDG